MSTDVWGRQLDCLICGDPLKHPDVGRPRVVCRRSRCILERKRLNTQAWRKVEAVSKPERADWQKWRVRCPDCLEPEAAPHLRSCPTHSNTSTL